MTVNVSISCLSLPFTFWEPVSKCYGASVIMYNALMLPFPWCTSKQAKNIQLAQPSLFHSSWSLKHKIAPSYIYSRPAI